MLDDNMRVGDNVFLVQFSLQFYAFWLKGREGTGRDGTGHTIAFANFSR